MRKVRRATLSEVIEIRDMLSGCVVVDEDSMVTYKNNMSDKSIAEDLSVSHHSVARVRHELFGKLRTSSSTLSDLDERITRLAERVQALEEIATS